MEITLISTYESGHQPFGLASPAAWLRAAGHQVECIDLSVSRVNLEEMGNFGLVAFHLPMHTATRLAVPVMRALRERNPTLPLCCFGLYAPLNQEFLAGLGVRWVFGGEFESALVGLADSLDRGLAAESQRTIRLERLQFAVPDRSDLPPLTMYSKLQIGGLGRIAGYTESSRGCKHLCRHCPVVPVYNGVFRVVQAEVVLEDIRRQIAAGAQHITFGDPDFFNGPSHARRIVEALHSEHPGVTYDATIKVEHLRKHRDLLPLLRSTGCVFVTSAVESLDDEVLTKLNKGHTREDFQAVLADFRRIGLSLAPTFIAFTPWTSRTSYQQFLRFLLQEELVDSVGSVQLALRLLIPSGSRLLELEDINQVVGGFDQPALLHRWSHPDPAMDALAAAVLKKVASNAPRRQIFRDIWELAHGAAPPGEFDLMPRATVPYLDEPWYC